MLLKASFFILNIDKAKKKWYIKIVKLAFSYIPF